MSVVMAGLDIVEVYQPIAQRDDHRLRPVRHPQLLEQLARIIAHCAFAEIQLLGDLPIAQPAGQQFEQLLLPVADLEAGGREAGGDFKRGLDALLNLPSRSFGGALIHNQLRAVRLDDPMEIFTSLLPRPPHHRFDTGHSRSLSACSYRGKASEF